MKATTAFLALRVPFKISALAAIALASIFSTASAEHGRDIYVSVSKVQEYIIVNFLNASYRAVEIERQIDVSSISGILDLKISKDGKSIVKLTDGYVSEVTDNKTISLNPGYSYGVALPISFVKAAYNLKKDCYIFSANVNERSLMAENGSKFISQASRICL